MHPAGSVGVGLALLALLNFNAPSVIMGVIALQVATPAAAAGVALYKGYQPAAVSLLLLSGMTMLLYVLWKQQVRPNSPRKPVGGDDLDPDLGVKRTWALGRPQRGNFRVTEKAPIPHHVRFSVTLLQRRRQVFLVFNHEGLCCVKWPASTKVCVFSGMATCQVTL